MIRPPGPDRVKTLHWTYFIFAAMAQNWKDKFLKILDGHITLRYVTM